MTSGGIENSYGSCISGCDRHGGPSPHQTDLDYCVENDRPAGRPGVSDDGSTPSSSLTSDNPVDGSIARDRCDSQDLAAGGTTGQCCVQP